MKEYRGLINQERGKMEGGGREGRMLTCMRGFTVGTELLQIRGIRLTGQKKEKKPSRDMSAGLVLSYIGTREWRKKMFTSF